LEVTPLGLKLDGNLRVDAGYYVLRVAELQRNCLSPNFWSMLLMSSRGREWMISLSLCPTVAALLEMHAASLCLLITHRQGHRQHGACFILRNETEDELQAQYLCHVVCRDIRFTCISPLEKDQMIKETFTREQAGTKAKDITFLSAISTWPKVKRQRQNTLFDGLEYRVPLIWALLWAFFAVFGLVFGLLFEASDTLPTKHQWSINGLFALVIIWPIVILIFVVLRFERRYYLAMESFLDDSDPE
jgi:hypothetical protein